MTVTVLFQIFLACICRMVLICGELSQSPMEGRIVGGTTGKIKHYPHSVYLDANCDNSAWHCGASIVNQKILLTAAHCVHGCDQDWTIIAFAGHEVIREMKLLRKVNKYLTHPKYNHNNFIHDISLLHLSKSLPFGVNIKRVIIRPHFPNVRTVQIAGWGTVLEDPETKATRLKAVTQQLMSKHDCKQAHKDIGGIRTDGMLCAKNNINNRPSYGDSGSALMTNDGTQVGLVSFRPQSSPEIIIYTNVTYYYQWIKRNAKRLFCSTK